MEDDLDWDREIERRIARGIAAYRSPPKSVPPSAPTPPPKKMEIAVTKRIFPNELTHLSEGLREQFFRNRVLVRNGQIDLIWMDQNLSGFFTLFDQTEVSIGFELAEDLTLFKLKFEGTA